MHGGLVWIFGERTSSTSKFSQAAMNALVRHRPAAACDSRASLIGAPISIEMVLPSRRAVIRKFRLCGGYRRYALRQAFRSRQEGPARGCNSQVYIGCGTGGNDSIRLFIRRVHHLDRLFFYRRPPCAIDIELRFLDKIFEASCLPPSVLFMAGAQWSRAGCRQD